MDKSDDRPMLDILEASRYLCVGRSTVYRLAGLGILTMYKLGRKTLLRRAELDEYLSNLPVARIGDVGRLALHAERKKARGRS